MCNQNCQNCYFTEINPLNDAGHCYMFRSEPDGDCAQFKFSRQAQREMQQILTESEDNSIL